MGHPALKHCGEAASPSLSLAREPFGISTPPRGCDDPAVWERWSAKATVTLAARKQGYSDHQVSAWFTAIDSGRVDRADCVMCAGEAGWSLLRTLREKWAGQDTRLRRLAELSPISALPPGGSWDGSLGTGFGAAWTEDQVGNSGNPFGSAKAITKPLTVSKATILENGDTTTVGCMAFHANGITQVEAATEGGTTETATEITYNADVDGSGWGSWGYWFTVNASDFTAADGVAEIRFKGVPASDGVERVVARYEVVVNNGGTIPIQHVVVDPAAGDDANGAYATVELARASPVKSLGRAMQASTLGGWELGEDGGAYVWLKAGMIPYGTPGVLGTQSRSDQTIVPYIVQPDTGVAKADVVVSNSLLIVEDTTVGGTGETSTFNYTADLGGQIVMTRNGIVSTVAGANNKSWATIKSEIEAFTNGGASYAVTIIDANEDWNRTNLSTGSVNLNVDNEGQSRFIEFNLLASDVRAQRVLYRGVNFKLNQSDYGSAFDDENSLLAFFDCDIAGSGKRNRQSMIYVAGNYLLVHEGAVNPDTVSIVGGSITGVETVRSFSQVHGVAISDIQDIQMIESFVGCTITDSDAIGGTHSDDWQWSQNRNQTNLMFVNNSAVATSYAGTQGYFFETVSEAVGTERIDDIAIVGYLFSGGGQCSMNQDGSHHLLLWSTFVDRDKAGGQGNWWVDYNQPGTKPPADYTDIYIGGCVFDRIIWGETGTMPTAEDSIEHSHVIATPTGWTVPGAFADVTVGEIVNDLFVNWDDDGTPRGALLGRVGYADVSLGWTRDRDGTEIAATGGAIGAVQAAASSSGSPSGRRTRSRNRRVR